MSLWKQIRIFPIAISPRLLFFPHKISKETFIFLNKLLLESLIWLIRKHNKFKKSLFNKSNLRKYIKVVMKSRATLILIIYCLFIVNLCTETSVKKTQIVDNWTLQVLSGNQQAQKWVGKKFNTSIPTTLHLDLLAHKQIQDSFLKDNYLKQKWISQSNIKYSTVFNLDADILKYKSHRLVFQGIDTYATIKLNGQKILSTQNAFRQYSSLVNHFLKVGQNQLQVQIKSTKQFDAEGQKTDSMPFDYAHTRKACYQYSWDWAPYLNTLGIWKKVYLQSFQDLQINYVWTRNRFISEKKAIVNFAVALDVPEVIQGNYEVVVKYQNKIIGRQSLKQKNVYVDVQIINPKLWWPNGIGKPFIYDFVVALVSKNQQTIDSRKIPYGIRSIKLDQTNKAFTVVVNGHPVYSKGANYVPMDMFYPRLTNKNYNPGNTMQKLFQDLVDSHFNMIRLWGGGQYQSDQFFELASRKGIMIFYDFMFSDSIYPGTQKFLVNVEEQVKQQIRRARNWPCLALWSGNNQILQGINDWGWSRENYRTNYKNLFEVLIPKIIQIQSPQISYIASSPVNGVGNYNFQRGGDFHYWGVWAGGSPFESYANAVGPFNSQFGTQGLPVWETICQTVQQKDRKYESQVLLSHQRHGSRFSTLQSYMNQYMRKSLNFELQTYQSGLLQAYALQIAIKAQRASKPKSMGTLYWQLNDAWPSISWSSIDYFGRWKPLQFMGKRLYPDIAIVNSGGITVINDKLYDVQALAIIQLVTFDGQYLLNKSQTVTLKPNQVKKINVDLSQADQNSKKVVLYTEIVGGRKQVMSSTHFFAKFNELELVNGQLTVEYHPQYKQMTLSSNKLLKNLFISNKNQYLKTSDNYFDLVPGKKVKVQILNETPFQNIKDGMVFRSYYQVYNKQPLKVNVVASSQGVI